LLFLKAKTKAIKKKDSKTARDVLNDFSCVFFKTRAYFKKLILKRVSPLKSFSSKLHLKNKKGTKKKVRKKEKRKKTKN